MNTTHEEQMTRRAMLERYLSNPTDAEWERFKWAIYQEMQSNGADGHFPITCIHRDDLEEKGYDASKVTNDQMSEIAGNMADAYCETDAFWIELDVIADDIGVPRKAEGREEVDA